MNKKILALALAIVFIATAFTACKRGPELTEIEGVELALATDKNGETIINDDNQIAVLVTDENNEVITYESGEPQTHWEQLSNSFINDGKLKTRDCSLGIPSGWEGNETSGRVVKKNTDNKCYIQMVKTGTLEGKETLDEYLEEIDKQDTMFSEMFTDEEQMNKLVEQYPAIEQYRGCKYTLEKDSVTVASLNCQIRIHKIMDKDGNLIHYVENYYFVSDKTVYKIDYACEGGKGYDQSFSFRQYLSENFEFKAEK